MLPMATVTARASRSVEAPPESVLQFLRDYRDSRPKILTDNFSAYRVEQGGAGNGTIVAYHFETPRRGRDYRLRVEEAGTTVRERDEFSSFVNVWSVVPEGAGSSVTLEASWSGAGGIGGIFERLFAPRVLSGIYGEILDRLAASVQGGAGATASPS
jgi:Polyketide cyclase / dehydrase and lipid transport